MNERPRLLFLKRELSVQLASLNREISRWTLEEKFNNSVRPCINLYFKQNFQCMILAVMIELWEKAVHYENDGCFATRLYFMSNNPRSQETIQDAKTEWLDFDEGGNRSTQRKPSKSGWNQMKNSAHDTTFAVEVGGVINDQYAGLTPRGVQHRRFPRRSPNQLSTQSNRFQLRWPRREPVFPFDASRALSRELLNRFSECQVRIGCANNWATRIPGELSCITGFSCTKGPASTSGRQYGFHST